MINYSSSKPLSTNYTKTWENRVIAPDIPLADYKQEGNARHFHLVAEPIKHNILSDVTIEAMGYNKTTPGPLIIIEQDQWIYITVENKLDEPTSLHVHGLSKPNSQDGAPDIEPSTPLIMPGDSYTYKFLCWQSGSFFYHSPQAFQSAQGLIGPFVVLPRNEDLKPSMIPDYDYVLLLQQWEIEQAKLGEVIPGIYKPDKFDRHPNFFTINGKCFPDTSSLYTRYGDTVIIRFINKSSDSHSMHLHGHDFSVVNVDGFSRYGIFKDTVNVPSGNRIDIEFITTNPGIWPLNGTKTFHQSNNGKTPGGMITRFVYIK